MRRTIGGIRAVSGRRRESDVHPPAPFTAPRTSFNTSLTRRRSFATTTLPLDEVRAVKSAFGVSINDVVLGLTAEVLRDRLEQQGELPDRPLVAGIPVATGNLDRLSGNAVSNMFTSLRTDIADPVERLHAIHEVTKEAKNLNNLLGADMLVDWNEWAPPKLYALFWRKYSQHGLASRHRPVINCVVSNVAGPRQPLYLAGARLVSLYSVGPILEGIGLNVTVWSYLDQLNVSAIACPEHVPDLAGLVESFNDALAGLSKHAAGHAED
jgi:diacylglycerol O-acyltransferase